MRKPWALIVASLLLAPAPPVRGAEENPRASTTLQQITREAENRLKEWDMMEVHEQEVEAKYWWLGLIELATALALGHNPFAHVEVVRTKGTE